MLRMVTLGFLHTAQVHVERFDALVRSTSSATTLHAVMPELLDRARFSGATPDLIVDVQNALADLVARGADVVVCTCSTLGPIAEQVDPPAAVVRVDGPMARTAATLGPRIGVVAALESTLEPTLDLLASEARQADVELELVTVGVPEAWASFQTGDDGAYVMQIAAAARSIAPTVDAIVLAQASMSGASALLADLDVPVLDSPQSAVRAALSVAMPDQRL